MRLTNDAEYVELERCVRDAVFSSEYAIMMGGKDAREALRHHIMMSISDVFTFDGAKA